MTCATPAEALGMRAIVVLSLLTACLPEEPASPGRTGGTSGAGGTSGTNGAGGSGAGGQGAGPAVPCDAPNTVLKTLCGTAMCHAPGADVEKVDLISPGVWERLVGVPPALSPQCVGMGLSLVNPTRPIDGVLFRRMTGTTCGFIQMPPDLPQYPDQLSLDCITSWVDSKLPRP